MLYVIVALSAIFCLLILAELLWRTKRLEVEISRKIVHIGTGIIVASWPYYLDWTTIQLLSLALLAVVIVSYKLRIFQSIHAIERLTIGEVLYPVGIGICALLSPAPWVFTVAVLHLTLADGLAAIIGLKYGKKNRYMLISHGKSLAGSGTFFLVSFLLLTVSSFVIDEHALPHMYGLFLLSAFILTLVENISWYGLDDVTVPIAVIVILTQISP